jgi:DNA polymerase-3 subunit delta'
VSINRFTEDMAFAPVFQADQLSHAYLVSGGDAGTRSALARTLAAAIVCTGGDRRPCGTCAQCKKALRGVHPDILHVEKPKDKASIPVDTVRAVCADAAVIPNDADAKVYIFDDASVLFPPAQNAMLKTLEEPPGKAAFILCLENPGLMLDTVRSRCVEIDLMPPAEQDGEKDPYVQAFFDALGEGNFALIRFSFSLDKLDKQQLMDFAVSARQEAVRLLRQCVSGEACPFPAGRLTRVTEALETAITYLEANVGTVHVAGMLSAALTEAE